MEYDVFRHKATTDENFTRINDFYKQVLKEDKELCNGAQKNLEAGIFINGQLHPEKEKVGGYFALGPRNSFGLTGMPRAHSSFKRPYVSW